MLLPQELVEIILDELPADDLGSLSSCSMTCRVLATLARPRIFHTIRLMPPKTVDAQTQCQKFHKLLSFSAHLAPLVKDLRIVEGNDRDYDWNGMKNAGTSWVIKSSRTLSLIFHVLKLKRLSIEAKPKLEWELMTRSLRAALKDATPGLEVIHLRGIATSAANELFSTIFQAEGLKSLSISYQMRRRMITNLTLAPNWRPQLRALAFSDHYTSAQFARALSASELDFSNLRSLSFSGLDSPAISAFLKVLPQENMVESLRIWYPISFQALREHEVLGIPSLPRLRTLRVRGPFGLSIFQQILEECTNTDLEEIAFEGHATVLRQAPRFESEQWERFVAAVRQSPVTRVHFLVSGQIGLEISVQRYRSIVEEALMLVAGEDAVSRLPLCPPTRRRT
ncbi:hypothetical protein C8F04DRAFT_1108654 [Mycena alexandri]|uniref:F-box domain-containing protein n=1 Tax=Mycena alexandri TaxID=1745969 RepID=A0AAD6SQL3_9AGAR|nr:hypothetical protein C8F04DRAFT_1108654 [Mycena alexandri]